MDFATRLEEKLTVDRLAAAVIASLEKEVDGIKAIDKQAMRALLERTDYRRVEKRDMELFVRPSGQGKTDVLVLDNELPVYANTSVDNVIILKNPNLKDMIHNAFKILYYKDDTVRTRFRQTVDSIHKSIVDEIDLSFTRKDIEKMGQDLKQELLVARVSSIMRLLKLFGILLNYKKAPEKVISPTYAAVMGLFTRSRKKSPLLGPTVMYIKHDNRLFWVKKPFDLDDKDSVAALVAVASQREPPDAADEKAVDIMVEGVCEKFGLSKGRRADLKNGKTALIH
ncbi:MAG: hypothetical protein QMD09_06330 [Desulfatibacillaceae bacterium]|nr:hypothetical protein [Desulfatibacillaceae bacterium]